MRFVQLKYTASNRIYYVESFIIFLHSLCLLENLGPLAVKAILDYLAAVMLALSNMNLKVKDINHT